MKTVKSSSALEVGPVNTPFKCFLEEEQHAIFLVLPKGVAVRRRVKNHRAKYTSPPSDSGFGPRSPKGVLVVQQKKNQVGDPPI